MRFWWWWVIGCSSALFRVHGRFWLLSARWEIGAEIRQLPENTGDLATLASDGDWLFHDCVFSGVLPLWNRLKRAVRVAFSVLSYFYWYVAQLVVVFVMVFLLSSTTIGLFPSTTQWWRKFSVRLDGSSPAMSVTLRRLYCVQCTLSKKSAL